MQVTRYGSQIVKVHDSSKKQEKKKKKGDDPIESAESLAR